MLLLAVLPTMGFGQSTLNFPKFFTAAELPVSGFAVANPGSTSASVTFTLYSANGTVVSTSTQSFAAGGQKALQGHEIFPTLGSGGWVQATSATTGLQGFWMNYDGPVNYIDGAETASPKLDQIIPLVAGSTELNVANPNTSSNSVTIRLFAEAGTELGTAVTQSVASNGVFQGNVTTMFPGVAIASVRYLRVTGSLPHASTALIKGYIVPTDTSAVNGVDRTTTLTTVNFPHVVSGLHIGGGNYTTEVGVTNLSAAAQTVTITFTPLTGSPITVQRTLAANGAIRSTAQSLLSLNSSVYSEGWIRVSGTAPLTGFVAYADLTAGGVAVVGVQETPRTQLLFAHIADLPPFWTGLAFLNTNSTDATVEVFAMTPAGTLIGGADNVPTARFTVQPNTKTSKLLLELVPQTQTRTTDGGFIYVRSNVPLFGLELFFNRNLSSVSNVPAGSIPAGITYTPPTVPVPLTLVGLSPTKIARGATLTLSGTGFSTQAAANTIIFTSVSGTTELPATNATSTSLTVGVPVAAISGPVSVRVGGTTSSSLILEVLATTTTLAQNPVTVGAGQTIANTDIYVSPPAAGLNVTQIGVFDVGAPTFAVAPSAVEISGGTTKELVVDGTGLSQANGSTLTVSGADITLSNVRFQGSLMIVRIAVAAGATTGARNVMVTNSNLDTSIISGGLIIR